VNISGEVFYPLIANGRLFLSFADGKPKLAAYDLQTGAVSWGPLTLPSTVSLAYDSGNLFGLDQNGNVSAWDGATGRALWTVTLITSDPGRNFTSNAAQGLAARGPEIGNSLLHRVLGIAEPRLSGDLASQMVKTLGTGHWSILAKDCNCKASGSKHSSGSN
jgi:outer membrane protein assembly factor BamB